MNIGVILAAGIGSRFNSSVHKQYLKLNGKEVVYYSIMQMREAHLIDKIILVVDKEEYESGYIAKKYNVECIPGGDRRNISIKNAIDYIHEFYPETDKVVFHDSVRPFAKSSLFNRIIRLLDKHDGVVTVKSISDTLADKDLRYVNRDEYTLVKTPEGFRFSKLYQLFDASSPFTAIVNQASEDMDIYKLESKDFDFKITYPEDLFLAEQLMRINYIKNGFNEQHFDLSRITGKVLILGGSGGMGSALIEELKKGNIDYFAPSYEELDLSKVTYEEFKKVCFDFAPDIIVNTAAVSYSDDDGLIETFDKVMSVNLKSNLYVIELAKELKKRVNIVVISSSSSTMGRQNITNYSSSKAALNSLVESQAEKLHEQRIYLNAIVPEKVNTPMIAKLHKTDINLRELLPVSDVVNVILYYCVTNEYGKLVHIRKGL